MKINKSQNGITLIALVVTIIILLILAGISITMLTGQNGILNRAQEAKEKTKIAQENENKKLQEYEDVINKYRELPKEEGTTPYLPNDTFSYKEGDLSTGLVIKDENNNEYVWVEVPTTIYTDSQYNTKGTPSNADDWEKIRDCLKEYTEDYSNLSYQDTDGTTYTADYKNMLKSVYTNGGFWIGRYEAGIEERKNPRTEYTGLTVSDKAVVKSNMYPYNYVKRDEAQELAERMNYSGVTSSLIYGVQWDCILKYIESKNVTTKDKLISDSTTIGNYYNSEFTLNKGKFAQYNELSNWFDYNSEDKTDLVTGSKKKAQSSSSNAILLTTGATEVAKLKNIYDIAGNVWEWTRDFFSADSPCVFRGGSYGNIGSNHPAGYRNNNATSFCVSNIGFRVGLWK